MRNLADTLFLGAQTVSVLEVAIAQAIVQAIGGFRERGEIVRLALEFFRRGFHGHFFYNRRNSRRHLNIVSTQEGAWGRWHYNAARDEVFRGRAIPFGRRA